MKFGRVDRPDKIDFYLPGDHRDTANIISRHRETESIQVYTGCAKWNRRELKDFYPRGTKDELTYYASRFNAVELNATFYRNFSSEQVNKWYEKVPESFRFFPKVNRQISHLKWLSDVEEAQEEFLNSVVHFRDRLGTIFLQLRDKFSPKHFNRLVKFVETWPAEFSLAVELRHPNWFKDPAIACELYHLLEENDVANIIVDTAGRRDLLHMRLTNSEAFIRYVGANHSSDYTRLDEWADRLARWISQGLQNIHFFVHQNEERESPKLADYFIRSLNQKMEKDLLSPVFENTEQAELLL